MSCLRSETQIAALPTAVGFDRWQATLELAYARRGPATVPVLRRHQGPLRVQKHFHPEGPEVCHHILVHPPGGIAGGDALRMDIELGTDAAALITSPGAAKWYRGTEEASLEVTQRLAGGAVLEWLPLETILYSGARCHIRNRIELAGTARLLYTDVLCLGRPGSGERFAAGYWRQSSEIRRDGRLLWCEQALLEGGDPLQAAQVGLGGATVLGMLLWVGAPLPDDLIADCRDLPLRGRGGVTQLPALFSARCLCDSTEEALRWLRALWVLLRPPLLGRAAVPPRIWAT